MKDTSRQASGKRHADLRGAETHFRYRGRRTQASELLLPLVMRFRCDGEQYEGVSVLDIAPSGLQLAGKSDWGLLPGAALSDAILFFGHDVVWEGTAEVVWSGERRAGIRFSSGLIDPSVLTYAEPTVAERAAHDLAEFSAWRELPLDWREQVGALRLLLEQARDSLSELENDEAPSDTVRAWIASYYEAWGPTYLEVMEGLYEASRAFDDAMRTRAIQYATREILPLWRASPIARRVYDKPLGYAGDYRVMQMYMSRELFGESIFGKFLTYVARQHTLGRAVSTRKRLLRQVFAEQLSRNEPQQIVSLACGPAAEAAEFIRELGPNAPPMKFIFIDQDDQALEQADRGAKEALLANGQAPVDPTFYHFSVMQLLRPRNAEEREEGKALLEGSTLIYSSGLYDYLPLAVARALTDRLYQRLAPGGRVLVGNMREAPDVSWLLEYVVAWPLLYRDDGALLEVGGKIEEAAPRTIRRDETGYCLFLEVQKPH